MSLASSLGRCSAVAHQEWEGVVCFPSERAAVFRDVLGGPLLPAEAACWEGWAGLGEGRENVYAPWVWAEQVGRRGHVLCECCCLWRRNRVAL